MGGGGGWVIYTVNELDSHAKHGQSFKKWFGSITEYFCTKYTLLGFLQVLESFFDRGSSWDNEGGNSLYTHFSRKNAPVHTSTKAGARERARLSMLYPASLHRDSLGKNISKEVCFCFLSMSENFTANEIYEYAQSERKIVPKCSNLPCFLHRELPLKAPSWSSSFTDLECSAFAESYFYNPLKHWLHRQLIRFWKRASVWESETCKCSQ